MVVDGPGIEPDAALASKGPAVVHQHTARNDFGPLSESEAGRFVQVGC